MRTYTITKKGRCRTCKVLTKIKLRDALYFPKMGEREWKTCLMCEKPIILRTVKIEINGETDERIVE